MMNGLNWNERIAVDPQVCHGKPVVRGTRTPVSVILGHIAGGDSFETLRREYDITDEDIRACIAWCRTAGGIAGKLIIVD
jgi:uncharacterized protein (DUF433 family)